MLHELGCDYAVSAALDFPACCVNAAPATGTVLIILVVLMLGCFYHS